MRGDMVLHCSLLFLKTNQPSLGPQGGNARLMALLTHGWVLKAIVSYCSSKILVSD